MKKNLMIMLSISFGVLGFAFLLYIPSDFIPTIKTSVGFFAQFSCTLSDLLLAVIVFGLMQQQESLDNAHFSQVH